MRILNVVGARPNFMKVAPLLEEMARYPDLEPLLVHTGQHYDARMSDLFFQELGIREPDHYLGVGSGTHAQQTGQIMQALEPLCLELQPALVLVVGDVNSTLAAALVAAKACIPLAHVEAGLRSFDRTMPEEVNRIVTDALAELLFTTEEDAAGNLLREGVAPDRIHFVGNVMVDTLLKQRPRAEALGIPARFGLEARGYAVLTLHRPSNVDDPDVLRGIVEALATLQATIPIVFPAHPRTVQRLGALGVDASGWPGLRIVEPLGYLEFLGLMAAARLVLTDSGGLQEETTALGIPCLTLRENTERPITVTRGTNRVIGTAPERIVLETRRLLDTRSEAGDRPRPPLWDGHAAERIVRAIRSWAELGRPREARDAVV